MREVNKEESFEIPKERGPNQPDFSLRGEKPLSEILFSPPPPFSISRSLFLPYNLFLLFLPFSSLDCLNWCSSSEWAGKNLGTTISKKLNCHNNNERYKKIAKILSLLKPWIWIECNTFQNNLCKRKYQTSLARFGPNLSFTLRCEKKSEVNFEHRSSNMTLAEKKKREREKEQSWKGARERWEKERECEKESQFETATNCGGCQMAC